MVVARSRHSGISVTVREPETTAQAQTSSKPTRGCRRVRDSGQPRTLIDLATTRLRQATVRGRQADP
ncbi:hypothetical protein CP972_27525 [Streptomyces prasinus]|uniref:Uncharacterized protein n=1 Tax=Streptomyces prasinus TaxID=67345 RepID=A0ABX6B424_9ACTN|nr:hypothetical protein CP972_27525 [Streptomyces prasinus]